MSREPVRPEPPSDEAVPWLDGLAGREGQGTAHAEGRRLRDALLPDTVSSGATVDMPSWAELERRAAMSDDLSSSSLPHQGPGRTEAANHPIWRLWHGIAAAFAIGTVLVAANWPSPNEQGLRGAEPTHVEAVWRTAEPQVAAQALAADLQSLGAQVALQSDATGIRLQVTAPPAAAPAVNQRLTSLETALDAQGRLVLRVLAP